MIIYCAYVYINVYRISKELQKADPHSARANIATKLIAYPLVLVICWFWGTVNTLQNSFDSYPGYLWLNGLHIFFAASTGILNAIFYGLSEHVREALRKLFFGVPQSTIEEEADTDGGNVPTSSPVGPGADDFGESAERVETQKQTTTGGV